MIIDYVRVYQRNPQSANNFWAGAAPAPDLVDCSIFDNISITGNSSICVPGQTYTYCVNNIQNFDFAWGSSPNIIF